MIGIINYGAGNLLSVKKAFEYLGVRVIIIEGPDECRTISRMVLPGVGAFEAAVKKLQEKGLYEPVLEWIAENKSFLGICLGMQLLFEESEESPSAKGFAIFKGTVPRFKNHRVPQIGWNQVFRSKESPLLKDIPDGTFFYFLHSYYVAPADEEIITGNTEYGIRYTSIVEQENIYAVQFHPEKSGSAGLALLKNWINLC